MTQLQLLVAFMLGALLMYGFVRLRGREDAEVKRLRAKLTAKTDELAAYKSDVQEHFLGTAKAMDELTTSYRGVFEQLEQGAHRLVGEAHFRDALGARLALERATPDLATVDETVDRKGDETGNEVLDNPASAPRSAVVAVRPAPDAGLNPDPFNPDRLKPDPAG